jgi:hypothetical protein
MTHKFHNKKSIFWLLGVALVIGGFLAFALTVPGSTSPTTETPAVHVPNMQNVPPPSAPHLQLDVQ